MNRKYPGLIFLCFSLLSVNIFGQDLPTHTSNLFSGSGNCVLCHQPGPPNNSAMLDPDQNDVSPVSLWRSSVMASAARDPLWQAKVSAEVAVHPQLQQIIEDKCTTCHSPMGRTEAHFLGQPAYSLMEMQNDPLAMDGVSCTACHQIKDVNLGTGAGFSGKYVIENDRLIYGPFQNPLIAPMQITVNYTPQAAAHVSASELCATCHTLFTPTIDDNGNIVGEIAEQTPYLEWANSNFPAQNIQCQSCHLTQLNDPIVISNRPAWLGGRSPYSPHHFIGANIFMLRMLKNHASEIGVNATPAQLDSTIARTLRLLREKTARIGAGYRWDGDTLEIKISVQNLSGHKFPTAYPSRRAWLYLNLSSGGGQSIFASGEWDAQSGEIVGLSAPFEAHHDVITHAAQTQVYQALMRDVNGNLTYTLLRGESYLKDNRLPPAGFTSLGAYYDSVSVAGLAAQDANFNRTSGLEGSGSDTVTFRIGALSASENYQLEARLLYQSLAPRFAQDLWQYATPEVATFQNYYQQADKSPITIDSLQMAIAGITDLPGTSARLAGDYLLLESYPNPFNPRVNIKLRAPRSGRILLSVYNLLGKNISVIREGPVSEGEHLFIWSGKNQRGMTVGSGGYVVRAIFESADGFQYRQHRKIFFMK